MVAVVTGSERGLSNDLLPTNSGAITVKAEMHRDELRRQRSAEPVRPLTHAQELVVRETLQRVRWPGIPSRIVLGHLWPDVLDKLTPDAFHVASQEGPLSLRSAPGYHVITRDDAFDPEKRDWLETFVVQAAHLEACFQALEQSVGLSHDEAILAVDLYHEVTAPFTHLVNAVGIYNALTWWASKLHRPALPETVEYEDEQVIQGAQHALQAGKTPLFEPPTSGGTSEGTFLLPGPRFAGEPLTSFMIREAILGNRFPRAFHNL